MWLWPVGKHFEQAARLLGKRMFQAAKVPYSHQISLVDASAASA